MDGIILAVIIISSILLCLSITCLLLHEYQIALISFGAFLYLLISLIIYYSVWVYKNPDLSSSRMYH